MARRSRHGRSVFALAILATVTATLSPAFAGPGGRSGAVDDVSSSSELAEPSPTSDPKVSFNISCDYTRSLNDDPIVFPNQPGASHLHDYFGNTTVDAFSTYESLLGQPTSCRNPADTAGYWAPAIYLNGLKVEPESFKAYYYEKVAASAAFPPGLGMVAGDSKALAPQSTNRVYFGCGSGSGISKVNAPPNCVGTGGEFTIHVMFPYCLNPATNQVAYPPCASGSTMLPQLVERIEYPIMDGRAITLASGPAHTFHADFFNSWDQAALTRLLQGQPA